MTEKIAASPGPPPARAVFHMSYIDQFRSEDLSVIISDLLVATADTADPLLDDSIPELLRLLRQRLNMDVVFVSEFVEGRRVFRFVDAAAADAPLLAEGESNPLEETFCKHVVEGRLPECVPNVAALPDAGFLPETPFPVGAHLSTPIVLKDGTTYGTLCCFSSSPNEQLRHADLKNLRYCAQLVARKLELTGAPPASASSAPGAEWTLQPLQRRP